MSEPTVNTAKRIAKRHGSDMVIVLHFKGDKYAYASYGQNSQLCREAQRIANGLFDSIREGRISAWLEDHRVHSHD